MIVVEGPDCVGKTTFCNQLKQVAEEKGIAFKVKHYGPEMAGSHIEDYMAATEKFVICDRFHVSEHVYDNVCRDGQAPLASWVNLTNCCKALKALNVYTVFLVADPESYEWLLNRTWDRGELYKKDYCRTVNNYFFDDTVISSFSDDHFLVMPNRYPDKDYALAILENYLEVIGFK